MSVGIGHARWQKAWLQGAQRRGLLACLLWPLSLLYLALIETRRALYSFGIFATHKPPVPVIVVGNVAVGGAGKTPATLALVTHLQARGWRPGVISRGHGRRGEGLVHVETDTDAQHAGDEPLLIRQRTGVPVCVAHSRVDAALALLARHPEVNLLVCDDGMQHLALGRDLTVAVFDDRGVGNGWVLPAGLLREPWPFSARAPGRPDIVLRQGREGAISRALPSLKGMPEFQAVRRLAPRAVGPDGQSQALAQLQEQPVVAVAGIARPEVFFDMLRESGFTLESCVSLPDHADAAAYANVVRVARHRLVCTEKDAVKLFSMMPTDRSLEAWAVPLELVPESAFFESVDASLARLSFRHGHETA